jgi:formate C-acetyltransferase
VGVERLRLITEFYRENEDEPVILKRAKFLRHLCESCTVLVEDDDLIVGNLSTTYRGSTVFPEFGVDWLFDELRDGTFESRDHTEEGHRISQEAKTYILSTEGYWKKRSLSARMAKAAPEGLWDTAGTHVMMYGSPRMSTGPTGHFCSNYDKVLVRGFGDVRREAVEKKAALEGRIQGDAAERYLFYSAVIQVCDAAILLSKRYAAACRAKAATAPSADRRAELLGMADSLDGILEKPCATFHDAVQAVYFYQLLLALDGQLHGLTIGRLDQYLWKFLEADLAAGRTTPERAQEVLDCFFLKLADFVKLWSKMSARNAGGYTAGQHITLGGQTKEGTDATNPVSFMMLQAMGRLVLHIPLSMRVHAGTPDELWEASVAVTERCGGIPCLENDEIIIPTLTERGLSLEDARNYCIIGCVEPAGTGCEWPACGGSGRESYFNLVNVLVLAINNGVNPLTGARGGPETGYLYEMKSFEEVKEAYVKQLHFFLGWHVTMTNVYETVSAELMPLPIVSAMMDGCMEKGRDVTRGGAKYNSTGVSGIGVANVADSLAAIKLLVFDTKKYTARELYDAQCANWKGYERLRQEILQSVPHYGNDDPYTDDLARWATDEYANFVNACTSARGAYRAGLYPVTANIMFGLQTPATLDGRMSGQALADGISPCQGLDRNGPTAVLKSVAALDHSKYGNGNLLNMKFHPKTTEGKDGWRKLSSLFRAFFEMGGMQVQYNVVSSDILRAAQKNPEEYKNLVVRIAGFSAYFVELYKDLQDDLIRRSELTF